MQSNHPGEESVGGSGVPITALKVPDEGGDNPMDPRPKPGSVLGEVQGDTPIEPSAEPENLTADHMRVLVAEDDPVNSRIVKKRLEKLGHEVHLTVNGEECSSAYCDNPKGIDVVLMDMQVSTVCSTIYCLY
jgi:hypothetical protein